MYKLKKLKLMKEKKTINYKEKFVYLEIQLSYLKFFMIIRPNL